MSTRIPTPRPATRKAPRQARSRATVEAIVQAGARVLGERGWADFTTNEVADVAGVSIGSLYQYFPDKRSLTEAIRMRHLDNVLAVVRQIEEDKKKKPLRQRVEDLVHGLIAAHSIHPALHRVLLAQAPRDLGPDAAHDQLEAQYMDHYRAMVAAYGRRQPHAAREVVAQVLSDAIDGVIHNAARRGTLQSAEVKRELVDMVCAYLHGADHPRSPAAQAPAA